MRNIRTATAFLFMLLLAAAAHGQTASGTINAVIINRGGIALVFHTDPSGVTLGNNGSANATLNFGNISAFGPLAAGVTRPAVLPGSYTVSTPFDVYVSKGALPFSNNYTLTAQLAAAAPAGFSYAVDAATLTLAAQTIQANGAYNTDVKHGLNLTVSTAAPGAGGPATGTPLTTTINFTATSN